MATDPITSQITTSEGSRTNSETNLSLVNTEDEMFGPLLRKGNYNT